MSGAPGADDWTRFTKYVLRCEGVANPGPGQVAARERRTRRAIADMLPTDARRADPLGAARRGRYDLLLSKFCLDCSTRSRAVWRTSMRHVFGLLQPGGSFVVLALRGCVAYRVGQQWFPGVNIQKPDLQQALLDCGADPGGLQLEECELPTHAGQGYEGMLLACGRTLAPLAFRGDHSSP